MVKGKRYDDELTTSLTSVDIFVLPSEMSNRSKMEFTFQITGFDTSEIIADLVFEYASDISANSERDEVYIRLTDFSDSEGNFITKDSTVKYRIPNQIDKTEGETIETQSTVLAAIIYGSMTAHFVQNNFMQGGLNMFLASLWNL